MNVAYWGSYPWWRHQMETFSALLAICTGNSPVPREFLAIRPVTRSFGVFFDLCLNKRLSKQWWDWWFETLSCPLCLHCNAYCCHNRVSIVVADNMAPILPPWFKQVGASQRCPGVSYNSLSIQLIMVYLHHITPDTLVDIGSGDDSWAVRRHKSLLEPIWPHKLYELLGTN